MGACELGYMEVPCVVRKMSDSAAARLAINLNTIHGDPNAELLAPFLAELDESILREIHIEDSMKAELLKFDATLAAQLAKMEAPDKMNHNSPTHANKVCQCPKCGAKHIRPNV